MATKAARPAKPRRRTMRETVPDTPDPVDIAMAAAASGKPLPEAARSVLEKHARLIDCQARLTNAQCAELRLRKIGESVRAALWAMLAIVALAIVVLIAAVVVRASRSNALIVQSFEVPPPLQGRGLSGKVVAAQVLDRLAEMQKRTESIRAASTYANNWENDLKIDIPNTSTTTDEVWKLLRAWLGKETRISGEVIDTGKGLALTARVGANAGQRFVSETGDLDELVTKGAELIYRETQPYRYAVFVSRDPKRLPESFAVLRQLTRDSSPIERKWAFNGMAGNQRSLGDFRGSIVSANRALAIDPKMLPAFAQIFQAYQSLGREQEMVDTAMRMQGQPVSKEYDQKIGLRLGCSMNAVAGQAIPDPKGTLEAANCLATSADSIGVIQEALNRAYTALFRHELSPNVTIPGLPNDSPGETLIRTAAMRLRAEIARGSSSGLSQALEAFNGAVAETLKPGPEQAFVRAARPVTTVPLQAQALSLLGRHAEAEALIAQSPLDCYRCLRTRGLVAKAKGDRPAAQRWFLEAAKQGPRLAPAFVDWGQLLLDAHRFESAEVKLREAARLAPNWADPLKYWGDALAAQGKRDDALEKYDAALQLAPKWAELRQDRARLLSTD